MHVYIQPLFHPLPFKKAMGSGSYKHWQRIPLPSSHSHLLGLNLEIPLAEDTTNNYSEASLLILFELFVGKPLCGKMSAL